jgi:hypothetical protein
MRSPEEFVSRRHDPPSEDLCKARLLRFEERLSGGRVAARESDAPLSASDRQVASQNRRAPRREQPRFRTGVFRLAATISEPLLRPEPNSAV